MMEPKHLLELSTGDNAVEDQAIAIATSLTFNPKTIKFISDLLIQSGLLPLKTIEECETALHSAYVGWNSCSYFGDN